MGTEMWQFIIFITIYAKSIYSYRTLDQNINSEYNIQRLQSEFQNDDYINPLASQIYYDTNSRRFFLKKINVHVPKGRESGRDVKSGNIFDRLYSFVTGGFMNVFANNHETRKSRSKKKNRKKTKPSINEVDDDYFDPIDTIFDGLDDMINGPPEEVKKPEIHHSDEQYEYSSEDEIPIEENHNDEYYQEPLVTEKAIHITEKIKPYDEQPYEEHLQTEGYVDLDQSNNEIEHQTTSPDYTDKMYQTEEQSTTESQDHFTERHTDTVKIPEMHIANITTERLTVITINDTTTIVSSTSRPYRSSITTKRSTTMPPTTKRVIRTTRRTTQRPLTTRQTPVTTVETTSYVTTGSSPIRPYRTKRPFRYTPLTTQRPQYTHKHKLSFKKSTVTPSTTECDDHKPTTKSWMAQLFGNAKSPSTTQAPHPIKDTTTKAPSGWFSFLGNDEDDEEEEEIIDDDSENIDANEVSSSGSWFSNLFSNIRVPERTTTTTTTTTTPAPVQQSWFDAFLSAEEDDGAYIVNTTLPSKKVRNRKTYSGYQLLRVYPNTAWKVRTLRDMSDDSQDGSTIWWSSPAINKHGDLLVSPNQVQEIKEQLNGDGIEFDVILWDLQKAVAFENPKLSKTQRLELERSRGHPLTWRRYHRYADILRYMEYVSLKYPDIVELIPLGRSSEGMPIVAAKISLPSEQPNSITQNKKKWKLKSKMKPAIWIDGGWHAREWISPAVATWILHALTEGPQGEGADRDLLKIADWYVLPVANPDGYEFTHTRDRLWRKTRSRRSNEDYYFSSWFPWSWGEKDCIGVDPNRNWDFQWGGKGSSTDPCSEYYAGPKIFSEPETKAVSNFLLENKEQMKLYLSLHSYSQMWIMPSSHSRYALADSEEVMEMGKLAVDALFEVSGTNYKIGTMTDLVQPIMGMAHDWAKSKAGIKYSYAVKMRDASGPHGFLLPGSQIVPTAKETFEAIKAIADNL